MGGRTKCPRTKCPRTKCPGQNVPGQNVPDKMSPDTMSPDKMFLDKMSTDKMSLGQNVPDQNKMNRYIIFWQCYHCDYKFVLQFDVVCRIITVGTITIAISFNTASSKNITKK